MRNIYRFEMLLTLVAAGAGFAAAVFPLNTDFSNTARGTGTGNTAFLYSADGTARLPDPSTYSANVQFVSVAADGPTLYTGPPFPIATVYQLDLGAAPVHDHGRGL